MFLRDILTFESDTELLILSTIPVALRPARRESNGRVATE
jgi:hypothetical protein